MRFHEIIVMAIAILGIQAGVYRRPMVTPHPPLVGTYIMTLQEVRTTDQARGNAQQPIAAMLKGKHRTTF